MADLVRLNNFTGDHRQTEPAPQELGHSIRDCVETGQFIRDHRQKQGGAASNKCLNVSQPVRREEVRSQHQACVCITALCGGVSWVAVTRANICVDDHIRKVRRLRYPGGKLVIHRLNMPIGLLKSQNWIVHQSEPQYAS